MEISLEVCQARHFSGSAEIHDVLSRYPRGDLHHLLAGEATFAERPEEAAQEPVPRPGGVLDVAGRDWEGRLVVDFSWFVCKQR